jgi:hypothetical protein
VRITGELQVGIFAIDHSVLSEFCFIIKQYPIKESNDSKFSTVKIEHEYCNHLVEEVAHVANGRDATFRHVWFIIPMM